MSVTVTLILEPENIKVSIMAVLVVVGTTYQGAGRTLVRYITVIRIRFQEPRIPSIVFNCLYK